MPARPPGAGQRSAPSPGEDNSRPAAAARTPDLHHGEVITLRSVALFVAAALLEIGGAWLVWQGVREHRGLVWMGAGVVALGLYGFVATLQPDADFGRILAAYGGVFVAGSLLWGVVVDGYRPDRYDITGAVICLAGVAVIMYAPRGG
jgi:small multidrug resistance family-3 protein